MVLTSELMAPTQQFFSWKKSDFKETVDVFSSFLSNKELRCRHFSYYNQNLSWNVEMFQILTEKKETFIYINNILNKKCIIVFSIPVQ